MAEYRVPNVNNIMISGHLTADPDLRYLPDGKAVCSFQVANSRRYLDKKTGEWVEAPPTFIRVTTWGISAEKLGERLRKGNAVFVEGRIQGRTWETPEGQKRSVIEINAMRVQNLTRLPGERVEEPNEEVKENEKEEVPTED
ncbi:MAG: single-stranded DNA-binding protein [Candidatus Stahlbacteria bacterium]|nr:single-stranded DNA-binding protein [Candidatus Stahlbacteria bacterium]